MESNDFSDSFLGFLAIRICPCISSDDLVGVWFWVPKGYLMLISEEREKIKAELKYIEGFIEVKKKKEEIEKRLGDIVEADPYLKNMGLKLEELIKKEGYDISQVQESDDKDGSDLFGL